MRKLHYKEIMFGFAINFLLLLPIEYLFERKPFAELWAGIAIKSLIVSLTIEWWLRRRSKMEKAK